MRSVFITAIAAAFMTLCAVAEARQYIGQNGRLLDANPQIGGGGLNWKRPVSPLLSGNAAAEGNLGRGFSLRISSPIASPYAFSSTLGSSTLAAFRRDSVSVADVASPFGGLTPRIYYDPTQTVITPRYLGARRAPIPAFITSTPMFESQSVRIRPTTLLGTSSNPLLGRSLLPQQSPSLRINTSAPRASGLTSHIVGLSPTSMGALNSTIFGVRALPTAPLITAPSASVDPRDDPSRLIDLRVEESRWIDSLLAKPLGTPLDLITQGADANAILNQSLRAARDPASQLSGLLGLQAESQVRTTKPQSESDSIAHSRKMNSPPVGLAVLPGLDVFTDLRLAMALSREPNASWFGEMKAVIQADPSLAVEMSELMEMESAQFADAIRSTPIRTFVGRGASGLNESLMLAEALLHSHDFFDSARQYNRARLMDPGNPLPLLGKGHASLGAGDYLTAVHNILLGLRRFPELTGLEVDLTAFLGGETIDIRRAELMQRLERREDPKLRFLLGYLEYYSGDKKSGLEHLKRAAEQSPGSSFINQFPALLSGKRALPPPKLPLAPWSSPQKPTRLGGLRHGFEDIQLPRAATRFQRLESENPK